jgi:hypothetical protein
MMTIHSHCLTDEIVRHCRGLFEEHEEQAWNIVAKLGDGGFVTVDSLLIFCRENFVTTRNAGRKVLQFPFSVQWGSLGYPLTAQEKAAKKTSKKALARRKYFDGANMKKRKRRQSATPRRGEPHPGGIFKKATGKGFKPIGTEESENYDKRRRQSAAGQAAAVKQIHLTQPAVGVVRMGLMTSWCEQPAATWKATSSNFPEDVLPLRPELMPTLSEGNIKKHAEFPELRKNTRATDGVARGRGIERSFRTTPAAHVWNILPAEGSLLPYHWVAKLTAAVLVVEIESAATRKELALSAKDALDRRFFDDAEVERFGAENSDEVESQARCRILHAFIYIMQPAFKGSWLPGDDESGESVKRVLELLLVRAEML